MSGNSDLAAIPPHDTHVLTTSWRRALALTGLLLGVILWFYRDTALYLVSIWNQIEEGEYGHGYLVLGIAAFLIFKQKERLVSLLPITNLWGLAALLALSVLWLLGSLADVMVIQATALVLMPIGLVLTVMGWAVTQRLLVPLGFILFAVPLWSVLSPPLQILTQEIVYAAVRALGVPALAREHVIVLPAGELAIEEACSGLRYLLAALTLGVLYAYLNYGTLWTRMIVVAVSALAAVVANLIRVFVVVYVGYTSDMQDPLIHDHLMLGWEIFAAVVFVLLFIDVVLSRRAVAKRPAASPEIQTVPRLSPAIPRLGAATVAVFALTVAVIGPVLLLWTQRTPAVSMADRELTLPVLRDGWAGPLSNQDNWELAYGNARTTRGLYRKDNNTVYVNLAYYPSQTQGHELVNETHHIADRKIWKSVYSRGRATTVNGNIVVLEQLLRHGNGHPRLVWYWYEVSGRATVSDWQAKLLQVWGAFSSDTSAAVFAVAMDYEGDDPAPAKARLAEFLAATRSEFATGTMFSKTDKLAKVGPGQREQNM